MSNLITPAMYEAAVHGRAEFRSAFRDERQRRIQLERAITEALAHLNKGRSLWNGPCHQCAAVLERALSSSPPVAQHTATSEWRDLLVACQCAMATATARYRISFNLPGDSQDVAGWVHELDKLQKQIFEVLKGDTDAR